MGHFKILAAEARIIVFVIGDMKSLPNSQLRSTYNHDLQLLVWEVGFVVQFCPHSVIN
jgi:hypothetical protein